jgi:hypothetical protein
MKIASLKTLFAPSKKAPTTPKPKPEAQPVGMTRDLYVKWILAQQEYVKQHPDYQRRLGMGDHAFWANPASYQRFADHAFWANPDSYRGHGR